MSRSSSIQGREPHWSLPEAPGARRPAPGPSLSAALASWTRRESMAALALTPLAYLAFAATLPPGAGVGAGWTLGLTLLSLLTGALVSTYLPLRPGTGARPLASRCASIAWLFPVLAAMGLSSGATSAFATVLAAGLVAAGLGQRLLGAALCTR